MGPLGLQTTSFLVKGCRWLGTPGGLHCRRYGTRLSGVGGGQSWWAWGLAPCGVDGARVPGGEGGGGGRGWEAAGCTGGPGEGDVEGREGGRGRDWGRGRGRGGDPKSTSSVKQGTIRGRPGRTAGAGTAGGGEAGPTASAGAQATPPTAPKQKRHSEGTAGIILRRCTIMGACIATAWAPLAPLRWTLALPPWALALPSWVLALPCWVLALCWVFALPPWALAPPPLVPALPCWALALPPWVLWVLDPPPAPGPMAAIYMFARHGCYHFTEVHHYGGRLSAARPANTYIRIVA